MRTYLPHQNADILSMLETIGVSDLEALFQDIPQSLRMQGLMHLEAPLSEYEVLKELKAMAAKNAHGEAWVNFIGAGAYEGLIPEIIPHLVQRQEFMTAYTPYQPEISQGTLQAIFEYQTMICDLTGMEAANASHYDGATAAAEAIFMILAQTRKNQVLLSETVHPQVQEVIRTYATYRGIEIIKIPAKDGQTDFEAFKGLVTKNCGGVYIQSPNFYGIIEDGTPYAEVIHEQKGLLAMGTHPIALSVLKSPGEMGADIAVGDGQPLGNGLNFGGPYLGYMATTEKLARKLPGRIVGQTKDLDGKTGYVLTLQAREQHIRREKATSNITSNQALVALCATIYMALLGKDGLTAVAKQSMAKARFLDAQLTATGVFKRVHRGPYFHEALYWADHLPKRVAEAEKCQFLPGFLTEEGLLICTTEKRTEAEILQLVALLTQDIFGESTDSQVKA